MREEPLREYLIEARQGRVSAPQALEDEFAAIGDRLAKQLFGKEAGRRFAEND